MSRSDVAFYFMPGAGRQNLAPVALAPHSKKAESILIAYFTEKML
jgi:hypothetical protein